MASKVGTCNMALAHLGILQTISDIDTEQSSEARVCRLFYEKSKNKTLRDYNWPFAKKYQTLSLVEEAPNDDWDFSYRYPLLCLAIRKILSGIRNDTYDSEVKFHIGQDNAGLLIFTDMDEAQIEFTAKCDNPTIFPDDFDIAHSLLLAFMIAPPLTKGDPFKMGLRAFQAYQLMMNQAASNAFNEQKKDNVPKNDLMRARE